MIEHIDELMLEAMNVFTAEFWETRGGVGTGIFCGLAVFTLLLMWLVSTLATHVDPHDCDRHDGQIHQDSYGNKEFVLQCDQCPEHKHFRWRNSNLIDNVAREGWGLTPHRCPAHLDRAPLPPDHRITSTQGDPS